MAEYTAITPDGKYLLHYGVKGMKWGKHVRKVQKKVDPKTGLAQWGQEHHTYHLPAKYYENAYSDTSMKNGTRTRKVIGIPGGPDLSSSNTISRTKQKITEDAKKRSSAIDKSTTKAQSPTKKGSNDKNPSVIKQKELRSSDKKQYGGSSRQQNKKKKKTGASSKH